MQTNLQGFIISFFHLFASTAGPYNHEVFYSKFVGHMNQKKITSDG